jgi:hypothetical protein
VSNKLRSAWRYCISAALITISIAVLSTAHSQQKNHRRKTSSANKVRSIKSAKVRWYTFRGPDGDFKLDFPTEPTRAEDVQGPVTVLRRYNLAADSLYFEISIQDFGGSPESSEANEFDQKFELNLSEMLIKQGFRIVQLRRTAKNIYEMEAWSPAATRGYFLHNLARGVIYKGRNYRMGCNSLFVGKEVNKETCRRFFNSFRISGNPK